jgi:DNA adenine methylase
MKEDGQYARGDLSVLTGIYTSQTEQNVGSKLQWQITEDTPTKPFVKWVGGKRQLMPLLRLNTPKSYKSYIEPFIGGGALLFSMLPRKGLVSDINPELINTYTVVRDDVEALIRSLKRHKNDEAHFYKVRAKMPSKMSPVQRASRFIYMNKTCFNGLYRENSRGQFNTPFGRYTNPNIADADNLRTVSEYLNQSNITIAHQDYTTTALSAKKGDFVYFDPPYYPMSATASFTKYVKGDFNAQNQIELSEIFCTLARRGCYVMLSNSNTDFIKDLYKDFQLIEVEANRFINCQGAKRGKQAVEVLVKSY